MYHIKFTGFIRVLTQVCNKRLNSEFFELVEARSRESFAYGKARYIRLKTFPGSRMRSDIPWDHPMIWVTADAKSVIKASKLTFIKTKIKQIILTTPFANYTILIHILECLLLKRLSNYP